MFGTVTLTFPPGVAIMPFQACLAEGIVRVCCTFPDFLPSGRGENVPVQFGPGPTSNTMPLHAKLLRPERSASAAARSAIRFIA